MEVLKFVDGVSNKYSAFARQMALSSTSCAFNYRNVILRKERDYKLTHITW
jgi:hypothetical protein